MTTQEIINDMRSHTITSMRAAADRLEDLQRANKNTLADLALTIERRDELFTEVIYLQKELKQAIAERTPHDYGILKEEAAILRKERSEALVEANRLKMDLRILNETARNERLVATRPEPSRLEIAAMAMQAFISSSGFIIDIPKNSIEYADALIAAARNNR